MSSTASSLLTDADPAAGLWQRSCPGTGLRVLRLQAARLWVELSIPRDRPTLRPGAGTLGACSAAELRPLAAQDAAAGVASAAADGLVERCAELVFQPDAPRVRRARVLLTPQRMREEAIGEEGPTEWQPRTVGEGGVVALRLEDAAPARGVLLVVGNVFMYALDRRGELPRGRGLTALFDAAEPASRAALLDCEVSYGLRRGPRLPWRILRSTLPFREGHSLFLHDQVPVRHGDGRCTQQSRAAGAVRERRWTVFEWTPGFRWFV